MTAATTEPNTVLVLGTGGRALARCCSRQSAIPGHGRALRGLRGASKQLRVRGADAAAADTASCVRKDAQHYYKLAHPICYIARLPLQPRLSGRGLPQLAGTVCTLSAARPLS